MRKHPKIKQIQTSTNINRATKPKFPGGPREKSLVFFLLLCCSLDLIALTFFPFAAVMVVLSFFRKLPKTWLKLTTNVNFCFLHTSLKQTGVWRPPHPRNFKSVHKSSQIQVVFVISTSKVDLRNQRDSMGDPQNRWPIENPKWMF